MIRYGLYLKLHGEWRKHGEFDAANTADAFRQAVSLLPDEHYDKPMALRPLYDGPAHLIEREPVGSPPQ